LRGGAIGLLSDPRVAREAHLPSRAGGSSPSGDVIKRRGIE
jgi:hypothetical protein